MAGHGSPPPEDRAEHPNRKVARGSPAYPTDSMEARLLRMGAKETGESVASRVKRLIEEGL